MTVLKKKQKKKPPKKPQQKPKQPNNNKKPIMNCVVANLGPNSNMCFFSMWKSVLSALSLCHEFEAHEALILMTY